MLLPMGLSQYIHNVVSPCTYVRVESEVKLRISVELTMVANHLETEVDALKYSI